MEKQYKVVVYVPSSHADRVRDALAQGGAGVIGNYTHCTFTLRGIGRFLPQEGASPHIGSVGKLEAVEEERIETICSGGVLKGVLEAVRAVHPYEEPAMDVYPVEVV